MLTTQEAANRRLAFLLSERARKIGGRLLERRKDLGLSRPKMAARFDEDSVTDDYLYRWEAGKVEPSEGYLPSILKAYEIEDVSDLYAGPIAERDPKGDTPDVLNQLNGTQLDRIERLLVDVRERLRRVEDAQPGRRRRSA